MIRKKNKGKGNICNLYADLNYLPTQVMANAKSITLSRGEKHVVTIGHVEEGVLLA